MALGQGNPITISDINAEFAKYVPLSGNHTKTGNFTITGEFTAGGNVTAFSDPKTKFEIKQIEDGALKKILGINIYNYKLFINPNKIRVGVKADELIGVYDELLSVDGNGIYSVDYTGLNIYGLKAMQEMYKVFSEKISELEKEIKTLKEGR